MQVISDIQETRHMCQQWRAKGETIAFVPTMGCLHAGHLSLVEKAQSLADHVVVSIFVNPLQFDDIDDLLNYPHILTDDISKLSDYNVDMVFAPDAKSMYPEGEKVVEKIELGEITTILEGAQRPGHFAGVATVVKRLFDTIEPTMALFGEKDFQQVMVIKRLVEKFSLNIEIIAMPTLREPDGLAMSSRNTRLNDNERSKAAEIYKILSSVRTALYSGCHDYAELEQQAYDNLQKAGFVTEYVVIREITTLLPPQTQSNNMVILAAAKLGKTRLIDNIRV